jgi:hypothetical protein
MFARPFAAFVLIAALATPAWAQDIRGALEGVVRDASGAVLPGATVDAQSTNGPVTSTTTDAAGNYRFPSLAPGNYKVTANLQGFVAREVVDVRVALGQIKKVDFSLPLSGVTETVQVTAETPLIDVRQSARQTNIRAEQIELLPKGRDFTTLVTQAPGANQESKLGGISIDGASACRRAATSRPWSRRLPAPTVSRASSVVSRSTARAPARTASSSTASRPPTSRTAPRART